MLMLMEYYKQDLSEQSELWESTLGGGVGFLFGGGGFPTSSNLRDKYWNYLRCFHCL